MKNLLLTLIITITVLSCKKENNYENNVELFTLLNEMIESDQNIKNLPELKNGSKRIKDSLWTIQTEIDKRNTSLLIEITQKRGWLSKQDLGCTEYIAPVVIFRHAPKKYWDEIKTLIDKEYKEGRMEGGDYMFIVNHLNGRPSLNIKVVDK